MALRIRAPGRFTMLAVGFEFLLGLLALLLGWLMDCPPLATVDLQAHADLLTAAAAGALCAVPLLGGIVLTERYPIGFLAELKRSVRTDVVPLFQHTSVCGLLAISLAAGVGEEMLFRGFLQVLLTDWLGSAWFALMIASVVFGICHWLCAAYALMAGLMGCALGLLFLLSGNLVAPIMTHAVYDFLALLYLVRWTDRSAGT